MMADPFPVLTIRQPWCWAIEHGKPVENRGWNMRHRGPVWLHAGARSRWDPAGEASPLVRDAWTRNCATSGHGGGWRLDRDTRALNFGAVSALAVVTGCHHADDCWLAGDEAGFPALCDPWAMHGQFHITLTDVRPLPDPVPWRGMPGLWRLPQHVDKAAREQLEVPS
jgi:hypothetical protein